MRRLLLLLTFALLVAPAGEAVGEPVLGGSALAVASRGPAPRHPTAVPRRPMLRAGLALAGAALLLARTRARTPAAARAVDGTLLALGAAGFLLWMPALRVARGESIHYHEFFHYYLNAKYFPELGYTRLYACATLADHEDGLVGRVRTRRQRDLETNRIVFADAVLAAPERCRRHFTAERWRDFRWDVRLLRRHFSPARWEGVLHDHGFNGTPAWALLGRALARLGPATPALVHALALVDLLLLAATGAVIAWAFGVQQLAVVAIFLGSFFPAAGSWTAGAFLRQDWLFASLAAVALLRRGYPAWAGASLAWAASLRLFPVLLLGGLLARLLGRWLEDRHATLERVERRLLAGMLGAGVALLALSSLALGGVEVWPGFAERARTLVSTPMLNHMGLAPVIAWDSAHRSELTLEDEAVDPVGEWKRLRRETFASRRAGYGILVGAFFGLLVLATRGQPPWMAAVLGIGLVPIATELTCYYYAILAGYALLLAPRLEAAVGLLVLAALSQSAALLVDDVDEIFVVSSVFVLAYVVFVTTRFAIRLPLRASCR